ncbi:MAG: prepilin peptidase [Alphaproteobacteria bacterium]|nr:prepilin peptidase [Alphaproteobacteria bacterium]
MNVTASISGPGQMAVASAFVLLFALAALSDLRRFVIPNAIVLALGALFVIARLLVWDGVAWHSHVLAAALILALGLLAYRFRVLAAGDVKLLTVAALWCGLGHLPALVFAVGIAGAVLAVALLALRHAIAVLAVARPEVGRIALHRALILGEGVPYGLAIAAGSIWTGARHLIT